jgi:hypothetical protein
MVYTKKTLRLKNKCTLLPLQLLCYVPVVFRILTWRSVWERAQEEEEKEKVCTACTYLLNISFQSSSYYNLTLEEQPYQGKMLVKLNYRTLPLLVEGVAANLTLSATAQVIYDLAFLDAYSSKIS